MNDLFLYILKNYKKFIKIELIFIIIIFIIVKLALFYSKKKVRNLIRNLKNRRLILVLSSSYYFVTSFSFFIIAIIVSFFQNVNYLFNISGILVLAGFADMLSNLTHKKIFFNIVVLYGLISLSKNIPTLGLLYKEIGNYELDLIFIELKFFKLVQSLIIIYLAYNFKNVGQDLISRTVRKNNLNENRITILKKIIEFVFYIIIFLKIYNILGFKKEDITMIISALGIGFGFAMQKIIANIFSGFIVLNEEKIRIGDLISISDLNLMGNVISIDTRITIVRNFKQEDVIVPNDLLINSIVVNMDLNNKKSRETINFIIDQKYNLKQVLEEAKKVADRNKFVSKSICFVEGIDLNGFNISLKIFTDNYDNSEKNIWALKSDIIIDLQEALAKYNIKFSNNKFEKICQD